MKRLVELHGGRVEAHSEGIGQGSTFSVYLPTQSAAPEGLFQAVYESSSERQTPATASAPRILMVDDNADAASTLSVLLKLKGYEVHTCHSGQAGLAAVEALKSEVVILDIGMPDIDGYQDARAIRQQSWGQHVFLIALTGYGGEDGKQRPREAGFDEHVVKPVDLSGLTALLTTLLSAD